MSKIEVNEIDKTSGSTLTLGGSGTAVTLACGATQSGFGATGGISWQTAIKTTDFTAVSGEGYFVNTSGGSNITVTLPASPSAGNVVAIKDYARTFGTNKVIMARNGSNMDGAANNSDLDTDGLSVTFVFMDSTKGWSLINDDTTSQLGASFVAATGGNTVATCGNFKIHTFTSPGTFCVSCAGNSAGSNTVSYMVIAGGGGGGGVAAVNIGGGGGGAGGYREGLGLNDSYTGSPLRAPTGIPVTATGFPITVGAGGTGGPGPATPNIGTNGSSSIFSTITSAGGGFGGGGNTPSPTPNRFGGNPGGSGGGASYSPGVKGNGNDPSVSPPQGNNGGCASCSPYRGAAGGGGATAVGAENAGPGTTPNPNAYAGALGGAGATSSINGTPTARASGGSGGSYYPNGTAPGATPGGGGAGGPGSGGNGCAGTANTGGGGGGAGSANPGPGGVGGAGGSGIVIIRYKFQ